MNRNVTGLFNSFDFGLAFGACVDLPMGLNLTLRYTDGLTSLITGLQGLNGARASIKNQVAQITVGYKLYKRDKKTQDTTSR